MSEANTADASSDSQWDEEVCVKVHDVSLTSVTIAPPSTFPGTLRIWAKHSNPNQPRSRNILLDQDSFRQDDVFGWHQARNKEQNNANRPLAVTARRALWETYQACMRVRAVVHTPTYTRRRIVTCICLTHDARLLHTRTTKKGFEATLAQS